MAAKKTIPYHENRKVYRKLPEIIAFDSLIEELEDLDSVPIEIITDELCTVSGRGVEFPIKWVSLGNQEADAPCLFLVGGIHGLERIGSQVVLTCLDALIDRMKWDTTTIQSLQHIRIVFVPIMNPIGIYSAIRSNAQGVDLMRNAPVKAEGKTMFILGGQEYSEKLPYYMGDRPMVHEMQRLYELLERFCFSSELSLSVDFHSGFGTMDQIWFPYAKTMKPFPDIAEMHALKMHFDESYPAHGYLVEPQALNYTTHGDFWDYVYDQHREVRPEPSFIPLTLEMGSWYWILKNPIQILSRHGLFNPLNHRMHDDVLRSHLVFFDFLIKAVTSHRKWAKLDESQKKTHSRYARELWYGK